MSVKIRLRRMGSKNRPFFRIVVADSRMPLGGRFLEEVGYYNPLTKPVSVNLNMDRIGYWMKNGAKPSETVKNLLSNVK